MGLKGNIIIEGEGAVWGEYCRGQRSGCHCEEAIDRRGNPDLAESLFSLKPGLPHCARNGD